VNSKVFSGFPSRAEVTPIPNLFFTTVMPNISDVAELKAILHIFWLLSRRRGYPQFVTFTELLSDPIFFNGIGHAGQAKDEVLRQALQLSVRDGILLHVTYDKEGQPEDAYFVNNDIGRDSLNKVEQGKLPGLSSSPSGGDAKVTLSRDIFSLYERNIGMLTPLIVEQLKEAENLYPAEWIEAAFKEATALNKRSWKYIARILERWSIEGKDDGKLGRDTEKGTGREKYIRGKYGHMVKG
jgi:DNA replication protein